MIYQQLQPSYTTVQQSYSNVASNYNSCQTQLSPYLNSNYPQLIQACQSNLNYLMSECNILYEGIGYYKGLEEKTNTTLNTCQQLRDTYQHNYDNALKTKTACYSQLYNDIYTYGTCKAGIIGCLQDLKVAKKKIHTLSNIANVQQHTIDTLNSDLAQCRPQSDASFNRLMDVQYGMAMQTISANTTTNQSACDSGAAVATLNAQYQGLQAQIQLETSRLSSNQVIPPNCGAIANKCGLITLAQCPTPPTDIKIITPTTSVKPPPVQIAPMEAPPPPPPPAPPPLKSCIINGITYSNNQAQTNFTQLAGTNGESGIQILDITASNGATCSFTGYEFQTGNPDVTNMYTFPVTTYLKQTVQSSGTLGTGDYRSFALNIT